GLLSPWPQCSWGRDCDDNVRTRKTYSVAFKQRMVTKLIGRSSTSANQLARETGISQSALSQWRREAVSLHDVTKRQRTGTLEWKVEILAATSKLEGDALLGYLKVEGLTLPELEQWRASLQESHQTSVAATKRIRKLERELALKEKALAEAAALLVLKKKLEDFYSVDEDDD